MSGGRLRSGREYVERARARGKSDSEIRRALARAGWSSLDIDQLLSRRRPPPPAPPEGSADPKGAPTAAAGNRIDVSQALGDAFRTVAAFPRQFILVGFASSLPLAIEVVVILANPPPIEAAGVGLFAVGVTAVGFAWLCAMALHVLRGEEGRLPELRDILCIAPAALVLGVIGALALSVAVLGPLLGIGHILVEGSDMEPEGGFHSAEPWLAAWSVIIVTLIFAGPISFVLTFLLVLPGLSLLLPAVADGCGTFRALGLSLGRGMRNFRAMVGLSIVYSVILIAIFIAVQVFAILVLGLYTPWLAALLSSAYLQTTEGDRRSGAKRS